MNKDGKNNIFVDDIIKNDIELKKEYINNVINYKDRIPLVEYKKEENIMDIYSKYHFINNIYINVTKRDEEDKFDIHFVNDNDDNEIDNNDDYVINNVVEKMQRNTFLDLNKKRNVIILLSGCSGCGKNIIREVLRKFKIKKEKYLRFSTYESWKLHDSEDDMNIIQLYNEKLKKNGFMNDYENNNHDDNDIIYENIKNKQSLIIEGVHLSTHVMKKLIKKYPNKIIYFLVYINDKETSIKRFATRTNNNKLPNNNKNEKVNKYIQNFNYISGIQSYLLQSSKDLDNTINYIENIDIYRSLQMIMNSVYAQK
ncbi:hypothetical protein PFHG_03731 [Plasmodium falciparum HB3]|uniref:Sulfotransferase domain-containing protein n=1 Tax=Plasmodium falciparum (isolate HB3) TaxID=137071 RepID=A0A0L7KF66_PLAFX|nr:hypothetical protein PFHG_03731 [Plasmodium falciparum HB3]